MKKCELDGEIILCRCEDIRVKDIIPLIEQGITNPDELKRILRIGMGPCQGKNCQPQLRRLLAQILNTSEDNIPQMRKRQPTMPVKIANFLPENIEE